jgi:nucleotide-binding universal stress UspA family protein
MGESMKRILVTTDFSKRSLEALRYALEYRDAAKGEIVLLHVVEGEPFPSYAVGGVSEALWYSFDSTGSFFHAQRPQKIIHRDLCEEAQWQLSALLPPGLRGRGRALVRVGKPAEEILRVAREQEVDLIIMGPRSRSGLRHIFRRGVPDNVRRRASIPVVTVDAKPLGLRRDSGRSGASERRADDGSAPCRQDEMVGVLTSRV